MYGICLVSALLACYCGCSQHFPDFASLIAKSAKLEWESTV